MRTAGLTANSCTLMTDLLAKQPYQCSCFTLQEFQGACPDSALAFPGLHLDKASQPEGVPGIEAPEDIQPQSPQQRPPNYLSIMLTYMAQVMLSPL